MNNFRTEHDSLGEKQVPEWAYYGVQTVRAIENFPISGIKPFPEFIQATAIIKKAAAIANMDVGKLDHVKGNAIIQAAGEIAEGKLHDHFVVDVFQAGAGTSHNMNSNEVIANRAIEILGGTKGDYSLIHPNDHVNMSQSTNDVFPTAMRLAALISINGFPDEYPMSIKGKMDDDNKPPSPGPSPASGEGTEINHLPQWAGRHFSIPPLQFEKSGEGQGEGELCSEHSLPFKGRVRVGMGSAPETPLLQVLHKLVNALEEKAIEFDHIIKSGRTHLQDAVPIRLGQEFSGYAVAVKKASDEICHETENLLELGIGGSAVGTGINTHPDYRVRILHHLKKLTGFNLTGSDNLFASMQSMSPFVSLSGKLKMLAVELTRIANDLRLLSSGPMTGFCEINLPPVQPGSSIMPGKVNPVMAEVLDMVCFQVIGNDTTITFASQAGQLELNVMMPVINFNLLQSINLLKNTINVFTNKCIKGITADTARCKELAERSIAIATVLNPIIGYEAAAALAKEAIESGKSIRTLVLEKGILSFDEVNLVFDTYRMTEPWKRCLG